MTNDYAYRAIRAVDGHQWLEDQYFKQAQKEGWWVFTNTDTHRIEIQRLDELPDRDDPMFETDLDAHIWVALQANRKSVLHVNAIILCGHHPDDQIELIMPTEQETT